MQPQLWPQWVYVLLCLAGVLGLVGWQHWRMHPALLLVATALITALLSGCGTTHEPQPVSLFNGVDLTGWHMDVPAMDQNPDTTRPFIVRDSMLVSLGTPGGHLITDSLFSNYRLEVEYRFAGVSSLLCFSFPSLTSVLYSSFTSEKRQSAPLSDLE